MPVKVFVLGPPGSGKSTACRIIKHFLQQKGIVRTVHLSDFDVLKRMSLEDLLSDPPDPSRFEPIEHGGFNIRPRAYAVLDEALLHVNRWLGEREAEEWVLVEFARNDYLAAFQQFDPTFLRDAYFLFLEAESKLCRKRLHQRIIDRRTPDDHIVSDYILDAYYKSIVPLNIAHFREEYHLEIEQVDIIPNNHTLNYFTANVSLFTNRVLRLQEQLIASGKILS